MFRPEKGWGQRHSHAVGTGRINSDFLTSRSRQHEGDSWRIRPTTCWSTPTKEGEYFSRLVYHHAMRVVRHLRTYTYSLASADLTFLHRSCMADNGDRGICGHRPDAQQAGRGKWGGTLNRSHRDHGIDTDGGGRLWGRNDLTCFQGPELQ